MTSIGNPQSPIGNTSSAVDRENPWPGLTTFTEEQTAYFFGRDEETRELQRRVERKALTVLFGQSGLGKSSLLQAGLFPRLRAAHYCPVYVRLDHAPEAPSHTEQIKSAVFRETHAAGVWTKTGSSIAGETLWEFFHHRDDQLVTADGKVVTPVLIFDQFEELFTLGGAEEPTRKRAAAFIAEVADLVENRAPAKLEARLEESAAEMETFDFSRTDYRVLITLREDYLPHLESLKGAMPSLMQNRMRLTRMAATQALDAVIKPGAGLVADEVASAIVGFVAGRTELEGAEIEPSLLSLVCRELNGQRKARGEAVISSSLLAGTRETILQEFYERSLADQAPAVRHFIEDELLTESGHRENIALERAQKRLTQAGADPAALDVLVNRRLLRIEERLDVRRVEITHDVLCGVVKASRELRHEREAKEVAERQLADTRAKESAAARALWRARMVASVCGVLALGAVGSAVFGYFNLQRARSAEQEAVGAGKMAQQAKVQAEVALGQADAARGQAEELLGFVLSDLDEQLTAFGQLKILLRVNEEAVTYYEKLAPQSQSPATRISHARALSNLGAVVDQQGDSQGAVFNLEKALQIFDSVAKAGPLPDAARIDEATTYTRLAKVRAGLGAMDESARLAERAEALLQPLVADVKLGGIAERRLCDALERKGFALMRGGYPAEAAYAAAIAAAEHSDARPPAVARPGLRTATLLPWLAEAQAHVNRFDEARANISDSLPRLRGFLEKEPYLASARRALAYACGNVSRVALSEWDFPAAEVARKEAQESYEELLKLDPDNVTYLNNLAIAYAGQAFIASQRRDFPQALVAGAAASEILARPGASNFMKSNLLEIEAQWALLSLAMGKEQEVAVHVARVRALAQELEVGLSPESADVVFFRAAPVASAQAIALERGQWADVRAGEADLKQRLTPILARNDFARETLSQAHLAAAQAAWAQGDGTAAERSLSSYLSLRTPLPNSPELADRHNEIGVQLIRARILALAGKRAEAREIAVNLRPEVEAVCGRAPDEAFTQFTRGEAYWTFATVDDSLAAAARRALLVRALDLLRPLAATGKLAPSKRALVLDPAERALAEAR
jgi:tetratricopeptide (TPR) repeat protein